MNELNDIAKASVRGGFFLFLGRISSTIIMALTSILVARLLGPENYGLYTVVLIAPSFLITLSDLGISPALTRFSAQLHTEGKNREAASLIKAGILFKLTFTLIISLFLLLVSEEIATHILNRPGIGPLIRIASLYLIGQAVLNSASSTFIGLDEAGKSSLLMNVQAVIKAIASPLLIVLGLGVAGAVMGTGMGFVVAAISGATILLLHTCQKLKRGSMQSENISFLQGLKTIISYGSPLYLSALIGSLHVQIRHILLALFTSNTSIGNYHTAMNFTILIAILASPIATTLFPAFSKLNIERDRNSIEKMFKLSVKYTSLIIIPSSTAIALLSKHIVHTLYGFQYQIAPNFLSLYMLSFLLTSLGMYVIGALFNGQGETRTTFKINLINLATSLPLASILIPAHGVLGLIASILTSQLISTSYGLHQVYKKYHMTIEWVSSLKILAASLSSALPIYLLLKWVPLTNPIYCLALGGILYVTSLLILAPIFGVVNIIDLENLEDLTNELPLIYPIVRYTLGIEKKIIELLSKSPPNA